MTFRTKLILLLIILNWNGFTIADNYCSADDININCTLCSEICADVNEKCYQCPKQCGKTNNCENVCGSRCRNGSCEYVGHETVPLCVEGCMPGYTGKRCQEYCPDGCMECHQFTANCISCIVGRTGEHCNMTSLPSSTTASPILTTERECDKECEVCNSGMECVECNGSINCRGYCSCNGTFFFMSPNLELSSSSTKMSTNFGNSTTITSTTEGSTAGASEYGTYKAGGLGALFSAALFAALFTCYKLWQRHHIQFKCTHGRTEERNRADGSSATFNGYTYIDDSNIDLFDSSLNFNIDRPPRCRADNLYESIGNGSTVREKTFGSLSSLSSENGTIFGNLFSVEKEYDDMADLNVCERQLDRNMDVAAAGYYQMDQYITPTEDIPSFHSDSSLSRNTGGTESFKE